MRAHLYTAVYRYIRPLPPPAPQRIAARRKDLGLHPTWDPPRSDPAQISGCALTRPRPQVRLWGIGRPPLPMAAPAEGSPGSKAPPPPPGPVDGLPCPCAARGAADGLPHVLPCPPLLHCCALVPARSAHAGRGGGGLRRAGGKGDHPVIDPSPILDTPDPEQQPLAAPVPATLHTLQHPAAPVRGGLGRGKHLDPAQLEATLQPLVAGNPGEEGVHPVSLLPAPLQ